ncbi:MAG: hypothetical protein E7311_05220 [Clostridiales bacterium]|nr:hypothetical protein [Clostridiales bacterium]
MEEQAVNTISETEIINLIFSVINNLFSTLFSSIDNTLYPLLDETVFINSENIFTDKFNLLFSSDKFNLLILANILVTGIVLYRIGKIIVSIYTGIETQFPYLYAIKTAIYVIILNFSPYICQQIINLNSLFTEYLSELGKYLFDRDMNFISLYNTINNIVSESNTFELFSIDGIIHSITTFGFISLLITYIIRFILIKILILVSPFAFLCLIEDNLKPYFFNWLKYYIILLLAQNIVVFVLYIPNILDNSNDIYYKILIVGVIYTLYQINAYIKEMLGGFSISNNLNIGLSNMKSMFMNK